ncbi:hypothetical protein AVEN_4200-1 [Araneus ventricosus]|uniref:Uncharacterized protein n=1 Tax=Araneus ventricosus TaxID=182803 RepID=A0A4Y2FAY0_ARAVE|nr:hypothetical protein AVEN_4200-1 [Araneus ventricosus]
MSFCVWTLFNLPCRNLIQDLIKFCHERIKISSSSRITEKVTVTIDRLKPAHLLLHNVKSSESKLDSPRVDTSSPTPSAKEPEKSAMPLPEKSPILTRIGRRVHLPAKYQDFVS